jgi:subtilase family serine protease
MHLLLNFDKLKKILLKNYFLRIKAQLQEKNAQLQEQNNQLQQTTLQLQEKNKQLEQTTLQLQEQNNQLEQTTLQLQEQNNQLEQTTLQLQEQYINRDYKEITYHHFLKSDSDITPHLPAKNISPNSFNGSQLLGLYNIPIISPNNPTTRRVKIGIIIAYTHKNIINDLNMYWTSHSNFGAKSSPPKINIYTFPGATKNEGWNIEECLDVQTIATINPNADIWVVEAKTNSLPDISSAIKYATNNLNVDVISMSFGANDTKEFTNSNNLFVNPSNPSNYKCFCASTGDDNLVCWPSVSSNIVAVGGTSLMWTPKPGNAFSRVEYTWDKAGCGYSNTVKKPSYQNNINTKNNLRVVPDISLVANPMTGLKIVYNGIWYTVGGTSLSCPIFAGILSLANQQRLNERKNPLTTISSENSIPNTLTNVQNCLYNTVYNNPINRNNCLTDVLIGKNGIYSAGVGYDIATGLGTPNATSLCNVLTNNIP